MTGTPSAMVDASRLAVGTLTVFRTPAPSTVDRRTAGRAMVLAPVVGALLAVVCGGLLSLLGWGPKTLPDLSRLLLGAVPDPLVPPLLAAALTIGLLAVLTRAMHLDGLADTADGLGSGKAAPEALEVMRRGDVGPFGVVTLVVVLLIQVLALADLLRDGIGVAAVALALVISRLTLPLACSRGVPAARGDGLGRVVAEAVSPPQAVLAVLVAVVVLGALAPVAAGVGALDTAVLLRAAVASMVGLAVASVVVRRAVRRLGGITGDVLGAAVEATFTTVLVVLSAGA